MKIMYFVPVLLAVVAATPLAYASDHDPIPEWVKFGVGWWIEGSVSDTEIITMFTYLIDKGYIYVNGQMVPTTIQHEEVMPSWIKQTASLWVNNDISGKEFLIAIAYLISIGFIDMGSTENGWESKLAECANFKKAYERLDCENAIKDAIKREKYVETAAPYEVGDITYYYPGAHMENTAGGQTLLTVRLMAINYGDDIITLSCSGPAVCNYDITNGVKSFKYASTDFTSGSITLKPDQAREFEMVFGPNIGYGGTTFVYDETKEYHFRINESFGSASIPLELD